MEDGYIIILSKVDDEKMGIMLELLNRDTCERNLIKRETFKDFLEGRGLDMRLDQIKSLVDGITMETKVRNEKES